MNIYDHGSILSKHTNPRDIFIVKLIKDDTTNKSENGTQLIFNQGYEELNFVAVIFAVGLVLTIILAGFIGK